ncbi:MAG: hypothetical protein FWC62_07910, partial [Firmicutes bacterium]|nr:hypothetical protein [Bacillota bacterium]
VVNTLIGVLIALLVCVVMAVTGGVPGFLGGGAANSPAAMAALNSVAPMLVVMFLGMSCTSCSSISMEGEGIWIIKALPVAAWQVFKAKILLNLTLTGTASILCGALLCAALKPEPLTAVTYFLLPLALCGFAAVFGVFINLKFPKLSWTNEAQVVKQSTASMTGMFVPLGIGLALLIGSAFAGSFAREWVTYVALGAAVILAAVAGTIANSLKKNGERALLKLGEQP